MESLNTKAIDEVAAARERAARLAEEAAIAAEEAAKLAQLHGIAEEHHGIEQFMIPPATIDAITDDLQRALQTITDATPDIALSTSQRMGKKGSGVRRLGFIQKIMDTAELRPEFIPPFFNLGEMTDLAFLIDNLRNIRGLALAIDRIANDALLTAGDESFRQALMYYNSVRDAARRRVPGAEELFRILELFFRRGRRADEEPTEAEVLHDVKSLLHHKKDGKIVIENQTPHTTGGVHEVIDETHKAHANFKATESGEIDG